MVEDFETAVKFFKEVLGMRVDNLYEQKQVAQFRLGSGQLFEVFGSKNKERKKKYRYFDGLALGFEVSSLDVAYKKLNDEGVKLITNI